MDKQPKLAKAPTKRFTLYAHTAIWKKPPEDFY